MVKVYAEVYGCWLNRGEAKAALDIARRLGATVVNRIDEADVVLLYTCAVRGDTERHILRRVEEIYKMCSVRGKNLVIASCLVNIRPYSIKLRAPTAILIQPASPRVVAEALVGIRRDDVVRRHELVCPELPHYAPDSVYYVVPIQTGCLGDCAFCVGKVARRILRSVSVERVVKAVGEAVRRGAREIFLTGQDVASYGRDLGLTLPDLLEALLENVEGDYRVRLGMMEPALVKDMLPRLLDMMKDPRVFKYFHLPVQSGDDKILKLMNRKYTIAEYKGIIHAIREKFAMVNIATDVIVGFPGEGEQDFLNTLNLIVEMKFDKVHVARYTFRPFTKAYVMQNQVPESVKKRRSSILMQEVLKTAYEVNRKYVRHVFTAIVEARAPRGQGYLLRLDNYKPVIVSEELELKLGEEVRVRIVEASPIDLRGVIVD